MLLVVLKGLCLLLTGFLSGSTLYSSLVEIPVRQQLTEDEQVKNWKLVFEKAHKLSKTTGLIACVLTSLVWFLTSNILWIICSITLLIILPHTIFFLSKTNNVILDSPTNIGLNKAIKKWDNLHHIRTIICSIGFSIAIVASFT